MTEENLYKILGVSSHASKDEIKRAYRRLATLYHPDKVEHLGPRLKDLADEELKKLNHAKTVLMDDEKRAAYDEEFGAMPHQVETTSSQTVEYDDGSEISWEFTEEKVEYQSPQPGLEMELIYCGACGYLNLRTDEVCHRCEVPLLEFREVELRLMEQSQEIETSLMNLRLPPSNFFEAIRNLEKWYHRNFAEARERSIEKRIEMLTERLINKEMEPVEYFTTITNLREWWKQ